MKSPEAISNANSDTKGKNVYNVTVRRSSTCMGITHLHGVPGGVFVNGSTHVIDEQSSLGGGGGNA